MRFYPGINGTQALYGSIGIKEVYYPREYQTNQNEDYTLLVLDNHIGHSTGYFGVYEL